MKNSTMGGEKVNELNTIRSHGKQFDRYVCESGDENEDGQMGTAKSGHGKADQTH